MFKASTQAQEPASVPVMRGLWMHFDADHEPLFRIDFEAKAVATRITLLILAILMIAATPLYDSALLKAPKGFLTASHALQFGVQIPALAIALLFTAVLRLRRYSVRVCVAACLIVGVSLHSQRLIGVAYSFHVPHDFAAFAAAMTFFLARIRFRVLLPWMLLLMVFSSVTELKVFDDRVAIYNTLSNWMLFAMGAAGAYLLEYSTRQNWVANRLLQHQASFDALTGILNRRQFHSLLAAAARQAMRDGKAVSLQILDIDHFKAYNDHYGHPAGDECIKQIGSLLNSNMRRPTDFCGRLGGEEFGVCWFDTAEPVCEALAEQLRASIGELAIPHEASGTDKVVTASSGYVQACPPRHTNPELFVAMLLRKADAALYLAKSQGRNCQRNAAQVPGAL